MSQFTETIFRIMEEFWETVKKNGIPGQSIVNQVPGSTLPPGGPSGTGYPAAPHDTAWADVTGTPTTLGGYGITDAASDSELATHEADTTAVHGITDTSTLYRAGGTDVALADGGTGASLSDPNADRIFFWDDSAGATAFLTPGTGLTITGTTIDATGGSALTIEEVDASPTVSATKLVFPNGTLGVVGAVATYTPAGGSGNATSTGASGSEPGSPASGDLYLPNNGFVVERYSGSVWAPWGPIYPLTEPPAVASGWTWVNQSTATFVDEGTSRYLSAVNSSDNNLVVRTVSAPYTVTACYLWNADVLTGANDGGLCFYDSSGGKLITVGHDMFSGTLTEFIRKWNSTSSHSGGDYIAFGLGAARVRSFPFWVRLIDDSTNRKIQYSVDGQHWITRHSVGRTDFMTADRVGLYLRSASSGTSQLTLLSWVQ